MYFLLEKKEKSCVGIAAKSFSSVPHLHSHMEIAMLYEGCSHGIADSKEADIEPGDLFIAFPNQIHYYLDKVKPIRTNIVILSPDMSPEFAMIFKTYIPSTPVLKNAISNPRIVSAIETIMEFSKDTGEFVETLIRGCTLVLLSEILRSMELTEYTPLRTDIVKDIINYCYKNYSNDISLQAIADDLNISRYYISHLFSRRLKIGFTDYINSLRIRAACELLKSGDKTITEIAYEVGYNSARTFNRCFMNIREITPKEYRKRALLKKKEEHTS